MNQIFDHVMSAVLEDAQESEGQNVAFVVKCQIIVQIHLHIKALDLEKRDTFHQQILNVVCFKGTLNEGLDECLTSKLFIDR